MLATSTIPVIRYLVKTPMDPRDRELTLNKLRFHYLEWGEAGAPPLILLHGFTGHARSWDHFAEAVAHRFRVLALDQRGHGDSDRPPDVDYSLRTMAADLEAFTDALCPGRFNLVGLSMGGRVSILYASTHPDRVARLVLVDIGPDIAPEGLARIRTMVSMAPEEFESEEQAYHLLRAANPRYSESLLRHRVKHGLTPRPNGRFAWKYDPALRDQMRQGTRDMSDLWPHLPRISCPTLIVRGTESDVLSPPIAKRMLEALSDARLIEVPDAGHTVPGDQPERFLTVTTAFLGR